MVWSSESLQHTSANWKDDTHFSSLFDSIYSQNYLVKKCPKIIQKNTSFQFLTSDSEIELFIGAINAEG